MCTRNVNTTDELYYLKINRHNSNNKGYESIKIHH